MRFCYLGGVPYSIENAFFLSSKLYKFTMISNSRVCMLPKQRRTILYSVWSCSINKTKNYMIKIGIVILKQKDSCFFFKHGKKSVLVEEITPEGTEPKAKIPKANSSKSEQKISKGQIFQRELKFLNNVHYLRKIQRSKADFFRASKNTGVPFLLGFRSEIRFILFCSLEV